MDQIGKLKEAFFLDGWDISVDFHKDYSLENENSAAECRPDWRYRRARMSIFPLFWEHDELERKEMLKHEFCHILLSQMMLMISGLQKGAMLSEGELNSTNEHLTSWLSAIIPTP